MLVERRATRPRLRTAAAVTGTALAVALVGFAMTAPLGVAHLTLAAFVQVPLDALVVLALALALPTRATRVLAVAFGAVLGLLTIVKVLDAGFLAALGRPFNPVTDWGYFGSARGLLADSLGTWPATAVLLAVVAAAVSLVVLVPLSLLRLTRLMAPRRRAWAPVLGGLGVVWALCAVLGAQLVPGTPVASAGTAGVAYREARQISVGLADRRAFDRAAAVDPFRNTPGSALLTGLRGKNVVLAFVESYGRVAVDGPQSAGVRAALDAGTRQLQAAGFRSESAYLTSPTFGGISWLAHSTLQSGLWVDSQQRYDALLAGNRLTLTAAFKRAGWRTVSDVPSNTRAWPEGKSFYHYDQLYDASNVGYAGPSFSYATMPDQYTLSAFHARELAAPHRAPVMAEIDLVSSHTPWTPIPRLVDWASVGDGSVFDGMPRQGLPPQDVWPDRQRVRAAYSQSVEYSLNALVSYVRTYGDDDLVLVLLGDHQPSSIVSGSGASHEVPVTIVARDPAVLQRIAGWGWQPGLRPDAKAPVWPMDSFRDRFLTAYGPAPQSVQPAAAQARP